MESVACTGAGRLRSDELRPGEPVAQRPGRRRVETSQSDHFEISRPGRYPFTAGKRTRFIPGTGR